MKCPDPPVISPCYRNLHYLHRIVPIFPQTCLALKLILLGAYLVKTLRRVETSRPRMSGAEFSRQEDPARHVYSVIRIHSGSRVALGESSGAPVRFCGVNKTFSETLGNLGQNWVNHSGTVAGPKRS